ncbi:MAG: hypothetical protein PVG86_08855 [Desulfobacterales bacterium]|jgi:hypothetical protein
MKDSGIAAFFFNRDLALETKILISDISGVEIQLLTREPAIFIHYFNIDSIALGIIRFSDELFMIIILGAL